MLACAAFLVSAAAATAATGEWIEYFNERYGFSLRIPADHFVQGEAQNPEAGNVWVSHDRQARLMAVAGLNQTGGSLESYRDFVMQQTYAGAEFTYTPMRKTWFVLSGIKDGQVFYERITFVCGGRYIYGWQMFYPVSQKWLYDRIVEDIHRSYRIGHGEGESCD